jgi:hypothetical protein
LQEVEDWPDASAYDTVSARIELPSISGCTLFLEGCDQSGGTYVTHKALDSAVSGSTVVTLLRQAPYGAPEKLYSLLRWRVVGPGTAPWSICFRITGVFK